MDKQEQIFRLFTGKDELRPVFNNPFNYNGTVCATDGHKLICTSEKNINFNFTNDFKPLKLDNVIQEENCKERLLIDIDFFEGIKTADEYKEVGKDVSCAECDGFGEVEWEYQNHTRDFDCPVCDGTGFESTTKKVKTGKKTYEDCLIKIGSSYFDIHIFKVILNILSIDKKDIFIVKKNIRNKPLQLRYGLYTIILMPIVYDEYNDKKVIELKSEK